MANRSYLFSLDRKPQAFSDRPQTASGLSEWPYDIPFVYRLLLSPEPQLCSTLLSDGLDDEPVPLYAIAGPFDAGYQRLERFIAIIRAIVAANKSAQPAVAAEPGLLWKLRNKLGLVPAVPVIEPNSADAEYEILPGLLDETLRFLNDHRDQYLLLETVELDVMSESEPDALRALVEAEIARCRAVGAAFEALPADVAQAAEVLRQAAAEKQPAPLDAFYGLRFDDACDSTRNGRTEHPLGLFWSDVLYFELATAEPKESAAS